jgi:hypothetical protein
MVSPVNIKSILAPLPAKAIPQLTGIVSINSFAFGRMTLKPAMIELFQKEGVEIGRIKLDRAAKARLMGMSPSFKEMIDQGKTAGEIFNYLELSLFIIGADTGSQSLFILGNKDNIAKIEKPINKAAAALPPAIEVAEDIEKTDWIERMAKTNAKTFPIEWYSSRENFPPAYALPTDSAGKLLFMFSALELLTVETTPPPDQNLIITEIISLYKMISEPEKQRLINIGITCACQLLVSSKRSEQLAGIIALTAIPINSGHPKLPEIGGLLAQIINRAPSNDLPAAITKAAARSALGIQNLLSESEKAPIRSAALNMASFYILLTNDYTRAEALDRAKETQSIAALLASIIKGFAPSPETKKEPDRSVLEKTFELTTFNDKEWRNENVTASVAQVLDPDEFKKILSKDYPDQRLSTIYEALSSLADAIGSIPPKAEIDHIFAEMRAIFRKRTPSFIPAGMGSAKYYLSHNDKFKRWTGAAILSNMLVASESRAAAEIIRMIEAFGQVESYRFVQYELIEAAAKIRDNSKPGNEINNQATRVIDMIQARIDGGGLL